MKKRGMSLPLQLVVIAAILLVVLVVVGVIFGVGLGDFAKGYRNCQAKGGVCKSDCGEGKKVFMADCPTEGDVCCLKD